MYVRMYVKLTVFLELRSRKTVRFSEQIMSEDKYPGIFSRQMEAIVYTSKIELLWFLISCHTKTEIMKQARVNMNQMAKLIQTI